MAGHGLKAVRGGDADFRVRTSEAPVILEGVEYSGVLGELRREVMGSRSRKVAG